MREEDGASLEVWRALKTLWKTLKDGRGRKTSTVVLEYVRGRPSAVWTFSSNSVAVPVSYPSSQCVPLSSDK